MLPTTTNIFARSEPTQTQAATQHTDSSFFTFLIALLILVFASGALVLRAILLRRRFRSRVQAAIDAGILPSPPCADHKPELYEVCVRAPSSCLDWHALMPVCATKTNEAQHAKSRFIASRSLDNTYHPSVVGRLMGIKGRHPPSISATEQLPVSHDTISERLTLQVAVLIAMPAEHCSLPHSDLAISLDSPKGKRRESSMTEDALPDIMFGVSTFPWPPSLLEL